MQRKLRIYCRSLPFDFAKVALIVKSFRKTVQPIFVHCAPNFDALCPTKYYTLDKTFGRGMAYVKYYRYLCNWISALAVSET